jgi:hypothetical protein
MSSKQPHGHDGRVAKVHIERVQVLETDAVRRAFTPGALIGCSTRFDRIDPGGRSRFHARGRKGYQSRCRIPGHDDVVVRRRAVSASARRSLASSPENEPFLGASGLLKTANIVMSTTRVNMSVFLPLTVVKPRLEIGVQQTMKEMLSGFATN